MAGTHVGQVVLTVNGLPIFHVKSINHDVTANRETVLGMSPTGNPIGFTDGPREIDISIEVYIPITGDISWIEITNGIISVVPREGGAVTALYVGFFVTKVGASTQEKGQATRKIEGKALAAAVTG